MSPIDAYKRLLAIQLHFKSDKYDIVESRGKVNANEISFSKRNDKYLISKLAKQYSSQELTGFYVANMISGDTQCGIYSGESRQKYLVWKGRQERLVYQLNNDITKMLEKAEEKKIDDVFYSDGSLPLIIKLYHGNIISLETLVIINKIKPFINNYKTLEEIDLLWPDTKRLIIKYTPFVRIANERDRITSIINERLGDTVTAYTGE